MWSVWVLLWKHSLQRKRRYIRAVFDYFTPILYFLLLHLITGRNIPDKHETIHLTEPVSLTTIQKYQHFHVLFTPNNSITNKLMDQVGPKMDLPRLNHLPTAMEAGYYPFSDGSAMQIQEFSKNMKFGHAIIIFENMESGTLPQKLKYTIRTNKDFMTSSIEPEDPFNTGHHQQFGDQYETFMTLQWAIDSSFLMLLTEGDIDEVLMQEFPYAAKQTNTNALTLMIFGSYMLPFALTLTFTFLTGRLFEEKNTGVHELVKMVGVSWEELTASHILELVPHMLIYAGVGTFIIEYDYSAPGTNGAFIFVALALHFLTIVALALVVVYVFNLTQYLELVSMAVYLGCAVGSMFTTRVKSRALSLLCCLLPQDPFVRFWNILGTREALGGGITASNMWSRQPTENISVAEVYLFMILQMFLLSMIAWYLSRVRPGRYGQALPWNFPFRKEYWSLQPRVEAEPEETQFVCDADQKYFEKAPAGLPVGIQINDVFKSFGKEPALHGVSLTVYRGEITVLLGHNGAGKTTLINIITGLISASSGRVLVEGKDTVKQAKEVRKLIGLCPQENIFFPNFTVLEHTMFFALLKGQSYAQARSSAYDLFDKLQITSKANGFPSALSGGMRRRAQLSCAIAGGARVLVLDEPTSGLDVETRRELWDLLLSLRGECTVLLTTHFMEEADALGDRVAALHHGRLRCHATAMFLKRAIGNSEVTSLQSLRGECTVLLTTHFMEEADALGDRVAALHHGRLRCHATAMFLKRAIGNSEVTSPQSLRGECTVLLTTHFMEEADALGDRVAALHHGRLRCHATAMFLKRAIGNSEVTSPQSLRGECTVLLTTHFMEEADALGDRVAALHHGRLRCHATAMFLKRAIGNSEVTSPQSLRGECTVLLTTHFMEEADALGDRVAALHHGRLRCHATAMFLKRAIGNSEVTSPQSLRGECTVLLTTHFMEEADALGDRVAALHHGRLRCHATAMFLKRAIGTGYRLSLTTIGAPQESSITSTITTHVSKATIRDRRPNGVSYNLPAKDTPRFPSLFAALEEKRSELRIDTIGVGKSTLDEVFLELCSDGKPTYSDELDNTTTQPVHGTVSGVMLYVRQFTALLLRQVRYILSHLPTFLVVMFFVILLFWAFTSMTNNDLLEPSAVEPNPTITLNLDLYSARAERRAAVNVDADILNFLRKRFKGVQFEEVTDVAEAMLQMGKKDIQEYNKYLVGLELNETSAKVLYTTTVRHAAPVALNLLSNALCQQFSHQDSTITTINHPLKGAFVPIQPRTPYKMAKHNELRALWTGGVAMVMLFYLCSFCRLPCSERLSGARHAHVQAGAARALHWAATLAAQLAQALVVCVLPVLVLAATLDKDSTFNQPGFTSSLFLVLVVGVVAFLAFLYFVTTLANPSAASAVLAICAFIFTQITPNIPESKRFWYKLLSIPYVLLPPHTLSVALKRVTKTAQLNAHCNLNRALCPALAMPEGHTPAKCCESPLGSEPWGYFAKDAAAWPILILACQVFGYLVLTYLSDSGVLERVYERVCARAAAPPPRFADTMARAEAAYVEKAIQLPKKQITDSILCHNIRKVYPGCCKRKPFFAVKGVSFSVKKGECFGLLGVNGAGKTTTFKMLTSQISPSGGDIFSNGHFASEGSKYMRTFSYCPQFAGLDEFLTGRQNLALLLTLRGLQAEDVATVSNSWIEEVDLTRHADKRLGTYSGGCARRLVAAAALCQAVRTALLDEPTSGVDPLARRKMHQALLRARKHHELIIASHSLDEMEALCHRIAIMSGGELRALGSAAALKAAHAQGYSLVFKLAHAQDVTDGVSSLEEFKGVLLSRFACELQDQHQSMLSYHVKESLRYSELFAQLEQLREQFPSLVEDYTVTETTLEEVFLALAKEARAPPTV